MNLPEMQTLRLPVILGLISENPLTKVKFFKKESKRKRPFTPEHYAQLVPEDPERLLYIWQSPLWLAYFAVLRDTVRPPGEISGLTWANWIFETALEGFYITKTANAISGQIMISFLL
jgi:hypothetical protein